MMTTEQIKTLPEWPEILEQINFAIKETQKEFPGTKVELVQYKYKFILTVNGEPDMEITADHLSNLN